MTVSQDQVALARILEQRGLADMAAIDAAAAGGERIAVALVRSGRVEAQAMAEAVAEATGAALVEPAAPVETANIARSFLADRLAAPLGLEEGRLIVAMADPADSETLAGIVFASGLPASPRAASIGAIERALGVARPVTAGPGSAYRSTVVAAGGAARTITVVATDRAAAQRSLHREGLTPLSVGHGEPSLAQRLINAWAPGGDAEAALIEQVGLARSRTRDLNAALAIVKAGPLPAAQKSAIDRIVARGPADPIGAIAAEPGLPATTRDLLTGAADQGAMLIAIAETMRAREALHVAARSPALPAACWFAGAVAILLFAGAYLIASIAALAGAIVAMRVDRGLRGAIAAADAAALAATTGDSARRDVAARLERAARTMALRMGAQAQAGAIALFTIATIIGIRG
ncbi:MAG: hypothetical protein DI623_00915 [Sphingomonas sanxanigenens]|uniref:Type II secretion system protein GspE N-terminal domain-containing protein n=1 Tax=Sphingomonas sanxanigenens TaxID=397260 RepID=A0A2W5ABS4_9SPHN|nr:MAG: hypothetical protein DI623_00915 [Sphingomonas sanxanigenens]